jgi:hypothetical protein
MENHSKKIKKQYYTVLGLLTIIYLANVMCLPAGQPIQGKSVQAKSVGGPDGGSFAGSITCLSCHKAIYESHIHTAHYRTSSPASKESIKGSFEAGKNHFVYNKWTEVVLEEKDYAFWQTAYLNGAEYQREPFDIVIGSGRKGQTYLYWQNEKLFQLPISYYTPLDSWCNSPGYSANFVKFNRQIPAHCIECHGTFAKTENTAAEGTLFTGRQIIYGVDCERCHGPGAEHVAYHKDHPGEKRGKYIINAKLLDRQQRLDACALCHSGIREEIKPAFSFQVGDKLDAFSVPQYHADSLSTLDVHGNQYGLLLSSKCFQRSGQMDCSSCHNVHVNEVNSPQLFSQRCMNCHNEPAHNTCTMPAVKELKLVNNCIDCHMPALPSQKIFLQLSDPAKSTPDLVRTHRIGIYPASAAQYLEKLKSK